jgi:hypothetical protein
MRFFKKRMPAKSLAVMLMDFTLTGDAYSGDAGRFALGPHGISVSDGTNVLPEDAQRTDWEHLSSRDSLVIALETMYLRGFAVSILVESLVRNKQVREAVLASYKNFWKNWSREGGLNYEDFYEKAVLLYKGQLLISDLEAQLGRSKPNPSERELAETVELIGNEFSKMCDPFDLIREPLRSELAKRGQETFREALHVVTNLLQAALEKYRITAT